MNKDYESFLDQLLALTQKSCPEIVARQGSIELWDANRKFVAAGLEFVKLCAKEAASGIHNYKDLSTVAITVYDGLCRSQGSFTEHLLQTEADFTDLMQVGQDVSAAMYNNIDALMAFDEIDQAHRAARKQSPKWKEN